VRPAPEAEETWRHGPLLPLARPRLDALERGCGASRGSVLVAALAAAFLRLDGRDDLAVVAAVDEREPFPVRLAGRERLGFRELAQMAEGQLAAGLPHRLFASSLFASTFRIPGAMKVPPVFDVGYLAPAQGGPERFAAPAWRDLALLLRVDERDAGV